MSKDRLLIMLMILSMFFFSSMGIFEIAYMILISDMLLDGGKMFNHASNAELLMCFIQLSVMKLPIVNKLCLYFSVVAASTMRMRYVCYCIVSDIQLPI